jgi:hypothetical protein
MTRPLSRSLPAVSLFLIIGFLTAAAAGQQAASPSGPAATETLLASSQPAAPLHLPDAPSYSSSLATSEDPQSSGQAPAFTPAYEGDGTQTKRILGIIPNFRSVSANVHLPPQTVKEKFVTASQDCFDYSSVVVPALLAGYNQARNETPEFHQGAAGYGRYFWHSFVDQTSENYFVEFIVPAVTHEDTRYYTLGHGGFLKRSGYAIKHVVVTRNDAGKDVFNSGEVIGSAMSSALSNAYYPQGERTVGNTLDQWGLDVGIDAFTFAFREFWPDINHALFHGAKPSGN